jgi:hypothetical protein
MTVSAAIAAAASGNQQVEKDKGKEGHGKNPFYRMPSIEACFPFRKKDQDVYQSSVNDQVDESAGHRSKGRMNKRGNKIQHISSFLRAMSHGSQSASCLEGLPKRTWRRVIMLMISLLLAMPKISSVARPRLTRRLCLSPLQDE